MRSYYSRSTPLTITVKVPRRDCREKRLPNDNCERTCYFGSRVSQRVRPNVPQQVNNYKIVQALCMFLLFGMY